MASEALSWAHLVILVATIVLGAVVVSNSSGVLGGGDADTVLSELRRASTSHGGVGMKSVALGYNANLDLVCDSSAVLAALGSPAPPAKREPLSALNTMEDFLSTFAFYYAQGSAAERRMDDPEIYASILAALVDNGTGTPVKGCQMHTGGNAALMANRFAALGVKTTLAAPVASRLDAHLHPSVVLADKSNGLDEVHLIIEHQSGDTWKGAQGVLTSPRANRFILTHDVQNSHMHAIEAMDEYLTAAKSDSSLPEVISVAGAHLLEGLAPNERSARLSALQKSLSGAKKLGVAVHFELAAIAKAEVLKEVATAVLPHSQSLGLNEQELGALYLALGGVSYSGEDFIAPTVHAAIHAIEHILALPQCQSLTRVHLHYLSYHIVAQRIEESPKAPWSRAAGEQSVAAGALMTTTVACGADDGSLDSSDVRVHPYSLSEEGGAVDVSSLFMHLSSPVSGIEFHVAPVLVCKSPIRTVGLGDSISATGLAYHII